MSRYFVLLFTSLWITSPAWGWGDLGHRLVAEFGGGLADPAALEHCHVTVAQLVEHTNDPDQIWREQKWRHPHEAENHFFHVDRQPGGWRDRTDPKDPSQGRLVYRILALIGEAKKQKEKKDWSDLAESLYGISHYIGDLSQPLHLHHDYDGEEAKLPGLHAQFETKMLNRYANEARDGVSARVHAERIPPLWSSLELKNIIFDTAVQSNSKVPRLFEASRQAFIRPHTRRSSSKKAKPPEPRFVKNILWRNTGALAMDQLSIGARLWGHALNAVCK